MNITPFVFMWNEVQKETLHPTCEGPYKVIWRTDNNFTTKKEGHNIKISIDQLKPAHTTDDGKTHPREKTIRYKKHKTYQENKN